MSGQVGSGHESGSFSGAGVFSVLRDGDLGLGITGLRVHLMTQPFTPPAEAVASRVLVYSNLRYGLLIGVPVQICQGEGVKVGLSKRNVGRGMP